MSCHESAFDMTIRKLSHYMLEKCTLCSFVKKYFVNGKICTIQLNFHRYKTDEKILILCVWYGFLV